MVIYGIRYEPKDNLGLGGLKVEAITYLCEPDEYSESTKLRIKEIQDKFAGCRVVSVFESRSCNGELIGVDIDISEGLSSKLHRFRFNECKELRMDNKGQAKAQQGMAQKQHPPIQHPPIQYPPIFRLS